MGSEVIAASDLNDNTLKIARRTLPMFSKLLIRLAIGLVPAVLVLALATAGAKQNQGPDPAVGTSYRVPYLLTETNHFIVRAKLNGKGPFNFVVDTGAPMLYITKDVASKAGVDADPDAFFNRVDTLELEGGARLDGVQTRVEDVFQLVGMNALGLPGVRIDGMLGFNVLARYRVEIDPTQDRMVWTRLDHEPADVILPRRAKAQAPPEVEAMNLLGGVAKLASVFLGRQPEDQFIPRGFLGLELAEDNEGVFIAAVLAGSPAAEAEMQPGDRLIYIVGRDIKRIADAHLALERIEAGDRVKLRVQPGDDPDAGPRELNLTAGKGL